MAQIFISHSQQDEEFKNLFLKAFSGTQVKSIFEEFERIMKGKITRDAVARDVENSRALFVILSQNVEKLRHTRDWIAFEAGAAKNKDVWVFEPYSQSGQISMVVPSVRDYVVFDINDAWIGYIRRIIESYDDSQTLPTVLVTGGLGALIVAALSERDKGAGAVLGGIGGAIIGAAVSDKSSSRPVGLRIECVSCSSVYGVHLPQGMDTIRCPVCNEVIEIKSLSLT